VIALGTGTPPRRGRRMEGGGNVCDHLVGAHAIAGMVAENLPVKP
jgi:hypothetical protein